MELSVTIELRRDGNMWSANYANSANLATDAFGFGTTLKEAIQDLLEHSDDLLGVM